MAAKSGERAPNAAAAEPLHWDFLRHLVGVSLSTANHVILARSSHFPLQVDFWHQILQHCHRRLSLDSVHLLKLVLVYGFALNQTAIKDSWQRYLGVILHNHLDQLFQTLLTFRLSWTGLSISMPVSTLDSLCTAALMLQENASVLPVEG